LLWASSGRRNKGGDVSEKIIGNLKQQKELVFTLKMYQIVSTYRLKQLTGRCSGVARVDGASTAQIGLDNIHGPSTDGRRGFYSFHFTLIDHNVRVTIRL
jgi:hypothetical protein